MNWVFRDYADVYDTAMFGAWRSARRDGPDSGQMPEEDATQAACMAGPAKEPATSLFSLLQLGVSRHALDRIRSAMRRLGASASS